MSQSGANSINSSGASVVELLTGNNNTVHVPPDATHNINIVGTGAITVTGDIPTNTLTISIAGGGFTWTDVTGATQALVAENGYVTDRGGGVTYTLPASGTLGDEIIIMGKLGLSTIGQNANQQILVGSASSTVGVGGTVVGTNVGDCMTLICITPGASTVWRAQNFVGNWTVT